MEKEKKVKKESKEVKEFNKVDKKVTSFLKWIGVPFLRYSLALTFIWFGILKPFGMSSAQELVANTVYWVNPSWFVPQHGGSVWSIVPPAAESGGAGNPPPAPSGLIVAIALGGAVGAVLRYSVVQTTLRLWGTGFPVGTLVVNVADGGKAVVARIRTALGKAQITVPLPTAEGYSPCKQQR